jgi:SAM-dependent methyltransferase
MEGERSGGGMSAVQVQPMTEVELRATEIAKFFNRPVSECLGRLARGFGYQHEQVALDWKRANPRTDEEILSWYRTTDSYVWELTAYHIDEGFAYERTCQSIAERLTSERILRVLCLGDGIGDLTLYLWRMGFDALYHDLRGSVTEKFAGFRFAEQTGRPQPCQLSNGWYPRDIVPVDSMRFDAVVSLDFLEHVTDVPGWARAIHDSLVPGGVFVAQNAFAIGSGDGGSMPMHLARNDRFEHEWDPLLVETGFYQLSPQWYRKHHK